MAQVMKKYQRTHLGNNEILERKLKLSVRCRTLLLLLESKDFETLNSSALNKIATPEYYSTLLQLGLIECPEDNIKVTLVQLIDQPDEKLLLKDIYHQSTYKDLVPVQHQQIKRMHQAIEEAEIDSVKTMMIVILKKHCGLMARGLCDLIEHAETTKEIRHYQGKWLTTLCESKICKTELADFLAEMNDHLNKMSASKEML